MYVTSIPGGVGARVQPRSGARGNGQPSLSSYPWTQRWEKNLNYLNFPADTNTDQFHWTELNAYYDRPDTLVFETNHLDAARSASVSVVCQGRREASHWTWVHVRNGGGVITPVADSIGWFGRGVQVFSATLPGAALTEGRTNAVGTFGKPFFGPPDMVNNNIDYISVNYFDVTYWRQFRALRGYLPCNSADGAGEIAVTGTSFTDSTRLQAWDVTNPLDPRRLTGTPIQKVGATFNLAIEDSVDPASRHRYVIFDTPKIPAATKFSPVTRYALENAPHADIIYIVPEAMRAAITPLAALRKQEGLDTLVAPLEGVNDEFSGGRKSDYAIRRFLKYAYDRPDWNTRFVLLVGDGSEDPQNFWGTSGVDIVPIHKIPAPVNVSTGDGFFREITPSDFWYVWGLQYQVPPSSGSVPAPVPDLDIGRLAVKDLGTLNGVVSKLVAYESVDTSQSWRRRMLLHSDDAYSEESTFGGNPGAPDYCRKSYEVVFEAINDVVRSVVVDSAALVLAEPEHFKQSYLLRDQRYVYPGANGDTCRPDIYATRAAARTLVTAPLLARLNDGRLWWNYQGHANEKLVAHEYVYLDGPDGDDKQSFTNYGKPFFERVREGARGRSRSRSELRRGPGEPGEPGRDRLLGLGRLRADPLHPRRRLAPQRVDGEVDVLGPAARPAAARSQRLGGGGRARDAGRGAGAHADPQLRGDPGGLLRGRGGLHLPPDRGPGDAAHHRHADDRGDRQRPAGHRRPAGAAVLGRRHAAA